MAQQIRTQIDLTSKRSLKKFNRASYMAKVILVDKDDNVIGHKERGESGGDDIHRIAGLWVTNSKDEVLIAQRTKFKKYDAGKWGPA